MIVRIDDVSFNTDFEDLRNQLNLWRSLNALLIIGINITAKFANEESVYPNPPFKKNERPFFYDVDRIIDMHEFNKLRLKKDEIASHGLVHIDHSLLSYDAQEMSILTSCKLLSATKFIPPFNAYNGDTESICSKYGIDLVRNTDVIKWRSLETHAFDSKYEHWFYHPWRLKAGTLNGLLQADASLTA